MKARPAVYLGFACLLVTPAVAQSSDEKTKACLECHTGSGPSKAGSIEIDPARFAASIHGPLGCAGCHDGYDAYPHKAKKTSGKADCTQCHTDNQEPYFMARTTHEVKASVHARLVDEDFSCSNCHIPHDFVPVRKMASVPDTIRIANDACLACHAKNGGKTELAVKHTWIPMWELHTRSARCVDCHTPGREDTVHLILSAKSAQRDCVACHSRDSLLLTKLYNHTARQERQSSFVNAVILNNAYMIGATKNDWLDRASVLLFQAVLAALALHALGRLVMAKRRKAQ